MNGLVIKATGSWYDVAADGQRLKCRIRGKLRLKGVRSTSPVVVGDWVKVECDEKQEYVICGIEPRRNYIIRRASNLSKESHIIGANIDLALLTVTLTEPETALEFVDRFLVTCQAYKVPVKILLAKKDLLSEEQIAQFHDIYNSAGYEVLDICAKSGEGVPEIKQLLRGKITLVAGNSGVGKSTLISRIDPSLDIRTGAISESFHKGKHTTTFSEMYPLPEGGYIIDTPGIKGFGLLDIQKEELCHYFPEMISRITGCRFYNCTHTHEPGCSVIEAVKRGEVAFSRYESYLKILDEDDKYRN